MPGSMHTLPVTHPLGVRRGSGGASVGRRISREGFLVTVVTLLAGSLWGMAFFRAGDSRLPQAHPHPTTTMPNVGLSDGAKLKVPRDDPAKVISRVLSDTDFVTGALFSV